MSTPRMRARGKHRATRTRRPAVVLLVIVVAILTATASASAYWSSTGSTYTTATTGTLAPPASVTVPDTAASEVPLSWARGSGGVDPTGYYVTRQTGATTAAACASSPTALIEDATTCSDVGVPDGQYTYVVTAVYASWTAPSSPSESVTVVNAATLAFVMQPSDTTANLSITPPVTVALRTADGDAFPASGVVVTIAIGTNPANGTLSGDITATTGTDGVATFAGLSINQPGTGYTLTATSPGLAAATSAPFVVSAPLFLGAAHTYSVLAATAVVNTGPSVVSGDLGVSPGTSISGFGPGIVGGQIHAGDTHAANAQTALNSAYNELAARPASVEITLDLGGTTLTPGVYHSTAALAVTGTLTLNAQGDPNAVFIFQTGAAFNTAAASHVNLINGAQAANVFWVVGGAANTGANSFLSGTILAQGAITLGASTALIGRALSRDAVTLAASLIRFTDAPAPTITIDGGSTAVTKDTTPTFTGTSNAAAGSPVTVTIAGQTLSTTLASNGTWTVTSTALVAGSYSLVAKVRDPSGNGTSAFQTLTVEVNPAIVSLGSAATYSVLARTAVVNTGSTHLSGDLGVSPADEISGFPPGTLDGTTHAGDSAAADAQDALSAALLDGSSRTLHTEVVGDLGGRTFHIGVHHSTAALAVTGTVTLDGEGNPNAVFIFQTGAAFNTAAASHVNLINGAQAANVFWVVGGAANTGANSFLSGTILAQGAITLGASTALTGRALSRDAVTIADGTLTGTEPAPAAPRSLARSIQPTPTAPESTTPSPQPTPESTTPSTGPTPTATQSTTPTPTTAETPTPSPQPTSATAQTTTPSTEPDRADEAATR